MGQDYIATKVANSLLLVLLLSGPALAVAVFIGLIVGFLQAVTQIQDQTLPQAVKLVAVVALIAVLGPALSGLLVNEARTLLEEFPFLVR